MLVMSCVALEAQTAKSVNLFVKETAGIRRFGYPVNARVPFSQGSFTNADNVRLSFNQKETPAQFGVESRWPDGSIQWLSVDFNAAIAPGETQTYRVEYGDGAKAGETPRGLAVTEDAETIQVGNVRFRKTGTPLLDSVKYRGEDIATGLNGIAVTDAAGAEHDLSTGDHPKVEIVKRGPLAVVIKYSGRIAIDTQYSVPFVLMIEMPNSKSWVKVTETVDDPAKRLRELSFHSPFSLGALPWVWDFGTEHWTYGVLRTSSESVTLTQAVSASGLAGWHVSTGPMGQEQPYENALRSQPVEWGHIQSGNEVVAFAIGNVAKRPGTYRVSQDGKGQASFRFAPVAGVTHYALTVYEHFVQTPVHIGAATSPASILHPLTAECEQRQYILSGVRP